MFGYLIVGAGVASGVIAAQLLARAMGISFRVRPFALSVGWARVETSEAAWKATRSFVGCTRLFAGLLASFISGTLLFLSLFPYFVIDNNLGRDVSLSVDGQPKILKVGEVAVSRVWVGTHLVALRRGGAVAKTWRIHMGPYGGRLLSLKGPSCYREASCIDDAELIHLTRSGNHTSRVGGCYVDKMYGEIVPIKDPSRVTSWPCPE